MKEIAYSQQAGNLPRRNLLDLSDNELALYAAEDSMAQAVLIGRYIPLVKSRAMRFRQAGVELDDLAQEGMIGLIGAIRAFDKNIASFPTFARVCVDRSLMSAQEKNNRKKQIPRDRIISIDEHTADLSGINDPEAILIAREEYSRFRGMAEDKLSRLEFKVLIKYLAGLSYQEISRELGITQKAVDNALSRIKRKLK